MKKFNLNSMQIKLGLLTALAVTCTVSSVLINMLPKTRAEVIHITQNYMLDVAKYSGVRLEGVGEGALSQEAFNEIFADVCISEMDSSYAYVVGVDGTMYYHPTADKIGKPVENSSVQELVKEVSKGSFERNGILEYEFNSDKKQAAYYVLNNNKVIVIVSADEKDVLASIEEIKGNQVVNSGINIIFWGILANIILFIIIKPLKLTTKEIEKLQNLDISDSEVLDKIRKKKDECGDIANSVFDLKNSLKDIINELKVQIETLYNTSEILSEQSNKTLESIEQVDKAVTDIAQGATSQAEETQNASEEVVLIGDLIEQTNREADSLKEKSIEMTNSNKQALSVINNLNQTNEKTKGSITDIENQIMKTNEASLEIKKAVDIIQNIASQTNLLSLNARIEAARAGDAGRGFAVVAGEIQKLADQSNKSADQISSIIEVLTKESEKSVAIMQEVQKIINLQSQDVETVELAFKEVMDGIESSVDNINVIADKTEELDGSRKRVTDVVQNLTAIAQENAASTEQTSASATEVGTMTENIYKESQNVSNVADTLKQTIDKFKI